MDLPPAVPFVDLRAAFFRNLLENYAHAQLCGERDSYGCAGTEEIS